MKWRIKKNIKRRQKVWKKYQQRPTYAKELEYKNIRNLVNKEIREAMKNYELELASRIKEDPKSFMLTLEVSQAIKLG